MAFEPDSPQRTAALVQLKPPAIALIVVACLGLALQGLSLTMRLVLGTASMPLSLPGMGESEAHAVQMMVGGLGVATSLIGLAVGIVMLLGALRMKEGRSYGFALAATILGMVPCLSPCCCLGLPIGIWALVILLKPEVKGAFLA